MFTESTTLRIAANDPRIPRQPHVFRNVSYETRAIYKQRYIIMKRTGKISGSLAMGWPGVWGIAKEVAKGELMNKGRKGLGYVFCTGAAYLCPIPVTLISNSTKVINATLCISNVAAAIIRCSEKAADTPLVLADFILFGEYVPSNNENSYNLFNNNASDFIKSLCDSKK